jgi:hypothetical protein
MTFAEWNFNKEMFPTVFRHPTFLQKMSIRFLLMSIRRFGNSLFGVRPDKWLFAQLCVSVWISICNGAIFIFGLMSPFLKEAPFNYDQRSVAIVSTVGAIASYLSLPTGYLFDSFGPRPTLLVGGLVSVVGWLSLYFTFRYNLTTSVAAIAIMYGICQLSASFYETGSLLTNLEAFRCQQGRIVILQKTFMGLGSSLIATYYVGFFNNNLPAFFLFLACFNAFWSVLGAFMVRLPSPALRVVGLNTLVVGVGAGSSSSRQGSTREGTETDPLDGSKTTAVDPENSTPTRAAVQLYDAAFRIGYLCLAACIILLLVAAIVTTFKHIDHSGELAVAVIAMILPFCFWFMLPMLPGTLSLPPGAGAPDGVQEESGEEAEVEELEVSTSSLQGKDYLPPGYLLNSSGLLKNIRTIELCLLWYICLCVWGASTVISGNGAQIYKSLDFDGYSPQINDVFVSIFGVASAIGRVIVGLVHPILLQRGHHISMFYPLAPLLMAIAMPLFLVLPGSALIVPFFASGLATGLSWGTTVLLMKSLFTPNNVGKHYNVLYTAGALTPVLFSIWMFAGWYDSESKAEGLVAERQCRGIYCVLWSLLVLCIMNLSAIAAAVLFAFRIRSRKGIIAPGGC